jgi:prophage regulatory protein
MTTAAVHGGAILRLPAVLEYVGIGRSTLYAMRQRGEFPAQVRLSPGCVGWLRRDVDAFIAERVRASREAAR